MSKNQKILLIDDAMMMRNLLKNILRMKGYFVCGEAASGEEGIELYKQQRPKITICDINMPGMKGIECLGKILEINPTARVIMCTAMGEKCYAEEAKELGAKGFIVKPIFASDVITIVEEVMNLKDYKEDMMEMALAEGVEQKDVLDFFSAFRSVTEVDMGDNIVDKAYLAQQKSAVAIGAEAFLAAKMPLDTVNKLVDIFNRVCEEG